MNFNVSFAGQLELYGMLEMSRSSSLWVLAFSTLSEALDES
ncbi:hypothetical protein AK812_SmicGene46984, partial [Symbiodinium microadriaticum]